MPASVLRRRVRRVRPGTATRGAPESGGLRWLAPYGWGVMSMNRRRALWAAVAAAGAVATGCGRPDGNRERSRTPRRSGAAGPAALPAQITRGPGDTGAVALTFHGQGDPKLVEPLLTEAERVGARLTVLAVGSWLDAYPDMALRVLDGGHELGNHTQNHLDICHMPKEQAKAEITGCADRLRRLAGGPGRWFRPSRARYATPLVLRLAQEAGYPHVLSYDVDSLDYTDPGPDEVRENVLAGASAGSVVSLHLGHAGTVAALPALLEDLRERGLKPVTASELLGLPRESAPTPSSSLTPSSSASGAGDDGTADDDTGTGADPGAADADGLDGADAAAR
jgi:peptidoglycan/xylan/chitin deacetylase (PgdA/CDA1 family)